MQDDAGTAPSKCVHGRPSGRAGGGMYARGAPQAPAPPPPQWNSVWRASDEALQVLAPGSNPIKMSHAKVRVGPSVDVPLFTTAASQEPLDWTHSKVWEWEAGTMQFGV